MIKKLKPWWHVSCLSLAVFIFITSEFIPVGLLSDISKGLGESEAKTGLLLTGYAWVVAITSLPLTLATASVNRKVLLVVLLAIFSLGSMLTSFANSFSTMLSTRILIAFCHAIFWSITTPLAARLAPYGRASYGLAVISTGATLGAVLGIPITTFIGQHFEWHTAFRIISLTAFIIMIVLLFTLPSLPSKNSGSFKSIPKLVGNKTLIAAYFITAFLVTGHFTLYTYLVPFLQHAVKASHEEVVILLFIFGISSIIGIFIAAKTVEKHLRFIAISSAITVAVMIIGTSMFARSLPVAILFFIIWSSAMAVIGISFQSWILRLAPSAADAAISVYSGIFNVGIGGGALVGSYLMVRYGVLNLGYFGVLFIIPAILLMFIFTKSKINKPT